MLVSLTACKLLSVYQPVEEEGEEEEVSPLVFQFFFSSLLVTNNNFFRSKQLWKTRKYLCRLCQRWIILVRTSLSLVSIFFLTKIFHFSLGGVCGAACNAGFLFSNTASLCVFTSTLIDPNNVSFWFKKISVGNKTTCGHAEDAYAIEKRSDLISQCGSSGNVCQTSQGCSNGVCVSFCGAGVFARVADNFATATPLLAGTLSPVANATAMPLGMGPIAVANATVPTVAWMLLFQLLLES